MFEQLVRMAAALELEHTRELEAMRRRLDRLEGNPGVMTVSEFARACGRSVRTIDRAIDADLIRVVVLGPRSRVIPVTELDGRYASEFAPQLRAVEDLDEPGEGAA